MSYVVIEMSNNKHVVWGCGDTRGIAIRDANYNMSAYQDNLSCEGNPNVKTLLCDDFTYDKVVEYIEEHSGENVPITVDGKTVTWKG